MKKYIVQVNSPATRDLLVAAFEKVGNPESISDFLIVQTDKAPQMIADIDGVISVEEDVFIEPLEVNQDPAPAWGLPWMSNSGGSYVNDKTGKGVDIYIIDSGIRDTNVDFGGRVETIYSFDDQPYSLTGVSPGHGTAVAGCAASKTFGTAKEADIKNCRIDFQVSTILKAADRVLLHHLNKPDNRPSVLNLSIGSESPTIGLIFERIAKYGISIIAAAGNSGGDTPLYPAKNSWVVSVGGINEKEKPTWFTNTGAEVYAPAQQVLSLSVFLSTPIPTPYDGTSFAAPYYAGLIACLLEGSDKFNSGNLVAKFNVRMRDQIMEARRIANFPNGGLVVRTATTKGLSGVYYTNPSAAFSNAEIREYFIAHADNPQHLADVFLEFNLSLSRVAEIAGFSKEEVNKYFSDAGVTPWWI